MSARGLSVPMDVSFAYVGIIMHLGISMAPMLVVGLRWVAMMDWGTMLYIGFGVSGGLVAAGIDLGTMNSGTSLVASTGGLAIVVFWLQCSAGILFKI